MLVHLPQANLGQHSTGGVFMVHGNLLLCGPSHQKGAIILTFIFSYLVNYSMMCSFRRTQPFQDGSHLTVARWEWWAEGHLHCKHKLLGVCTSADTHSCQKEGCFSLLRHVVLQNDFLYLLNFICSAKKKCEHKS